jgi:hypothetical protein
MDPWRGNWRPELNSRQNYGGTGRSPVKGYRTHQGVSVTQVGERMWLVTFMHYDLGYFDDETCRLEPIDNPFGRKC